LLQWPRAPDATASDQEGGRNRRRCGPAAAPSRHGMMELRALGLRFVDVGCSGSLPDRWAPLTDCIDYVGFEPDAASRQRLEEAPPPFRSRRILPHAVAGRSGVATLCRTRSPHCSSLLEPRHAWLERFRYRDLFLEEGRTEVACVTLDEAAKEHDLRADVLKLDSQGLERPILETAGALLDDLLCLDVEAGFVENYVGESTLADVDPFLRARGFLMFDLEPRRQLRVGPAEGRGQPLWAETIWLRDWLSEASFGIARPEPTAERLLRTAFLATFLGHADYARELDPLMADADVSAAAIEANRAEAERRARLRRPGRHPRLRRAAAEIAALAPVRVRRALAAALSDTLR